MSDGTLTNRDDKTNTKTAKQRRFARVNATKVYWVTFGVITVPLLALWLAAVGPTLQPWLFPKTYPDGMTTLPPGSILITPENFAEIDRMDKELAFNRMTALFSGVIALVFSAACSFCVTGLVLGLLYRREVFRAVLIWFRT